MDTFTILMVASLVAGFTLQYCAAHADDIRRGVDEVVDRFDGD